MWRVMWRPVRLINVAVSGAQYSRPLIHSCVPVRIGLKPLNCSYIRGKGVGWHWFGPSPAVKAESQSLPTHPWENPSIRMAILRGKFTFCLSERNMREEERETVFPPPLRISYCHNDNMTKHIPGQYVSVSFLITLTSQHQSLLKNPHTHHTHTQHF